ncbi:MAG: glycoside hydrolase family 92 protein [Bacteroidales bacterium]|nr:glycoside hydrolase family 92 protein [Bacteroidales bacterium]
MKLTHFALFTAAALILIGCGKSAETDYTAYVDTQIGTGGHGHVFVGANVPFGFVQLGPTSIPQDWDWCSGYHHSDSTVIGFSHTHLGGTGIGDLFDITLMPVIGEVTYARGNNEDQQSGLWSYADRSKEISVPGYYSVPLLRYGITAEMTATTRTGLSRYTFPSSEDAAIVIDLRNGGCWDSLTESNFIIGEDNATVCGWRFSKGWADNQKVYFAAEFSKKFDEAQINGKADEYLRLCFKTSENEQIMVKVGLSSVSVDGAKAALATEMAGWDFEATAAAAKKAWNSELGKINIQTTDATARTIFYTALYHTMVAPSIFCDVDGSYYGADKQNHKSDGFVNYTTYSLWDTYRAAMPLMSVIHKDKMADVVNTMIYIHQQQGKLPVWHLMGCETDCMVGNPGVIAVADAIIKKTPGVDPVIAYKACKESVMLDERGQGFRKQYGYIPSDLYNTSVSCDMEYAIADACVAQAALVMAEAYPADKDAYLADFEFFNERSHSYRHFFDPECGFMRGRNTDGSFSEPFSPYHSNHFKSDYCEGNGWQYTFLVPQDLEGLEACFGGREKFIEKLDSLFIVSSVLEGENSSPDISGLIGQFAHGNEPSHHILYLYTMAGEQAKGAERIRETLSTLYHADYEGLSGNEDVGQMSAWYVLSSIGLYQADPSHPFFWFGSPIFDKTTITLPDGEFTIVAHNNSETNKVIKSARLDGQILDKPYITFDQIKGGSTLEFEMGE